MKKANSNLHFETVEIAHVPRERKGKHAILMRRLLQDLERIGYDVALKIPLPGNQKIENLRAALTRETKKVNLLVGTSFDGQYFYVWRRKS